MTDSDRLAFNAWADSTPAVVFGTHVTRAQYSAVVASAKDYAWKAWAEATRQAQARTAPLPVNVPIRVFCDEQGKAQVERL